MFQALALLSLQKRGKVMALRMKVWAYPEDVFSVWLILAAKYQDT